MTISLIAAMGKNRELGFRGALPWHLPDDLKRFKSLTVGHPVIMGRKTYESMGKPLPNRGNIVVTRDADYSAPGCRVAHSMEEAIAMAKNSEEVFVIGGAEMYRLALPYTNRMYLTFVDADVPADAFFPEFDESKWRISLNEVHGKDEKHAYGFTFKNFERKGETPRVLKDGI